MVGPPLFHQHLLRVRPPANSPELDHIEAAYTSASAVSLGVSLVTALVGASLVTWYLTRRLQAPLEALTDAAERMSQGRYDTRVPETAAAGPELATLAAAFNEMAAQLETTEDTRRRLLTDLAHEMRTPVATITAYLDGLEDGVAGWDADTARVMREQADRLARLAVDVEQVSRAEEHRITLHEARVRVGDLLWSAAAAARAALRGQGCLLVTEPADAAGLWVLADAQRLGQALGNLLSNALRHSRAGGAVTLSAAPVGRDQVTLTVTDTGDGIAPEQLPHVFERFYRGDPARDRAQGGTGIGLTIARALVEAHEGTLTASSAGVCRGATFTVTLPTAR